MKDSSIPNVPVILTITDTSDSPKFNLPDGYTFATYNEDEHDDFEVSWVKLCMDENYFSNFADALDYFESSIVPLQDALKTKFVFVKDSQGSIVATAALWHGFDFGTTKPRIHFIAVNPACHMQGIAKAMVTKLLEIFNSFPKNNFLYVLTQTQSYALCNMFLTFDFEPYFDERPVKWNMSVETFEATKYRAWQLIIDKINIRYPDVEIFEDDDDEEDEEETQE
ncbi:MAG: GNAT family N-acetyltransferase [Oscillospiraceae bacterium]